MKGYFTKNKKILMKLLRMLAYSLLLALLVLIFTRKIMFAVMIGCVPPSINVIKKGFGSKYIRCPFLQGVIGGVSIGVIVRFIAAICSNIAN